MKPAVKIYACVVDTLGRLGQLGQAMEFTKNMPITHGPSVWGSFFTTYVIHRNSMAWDWCLLELEPEDPSNYISLSNTYTKLRCVTVRIKSDWKVTIFGFFKTQWL